MKKIYIIDDDKDIVESLTIVLSGQGYEVKAQYNEKDAVTNVTEFAPHLIILDVMFPEDDGAGFEMAREFHQHDSTREIPILMLSAVNAKGDYAGTFSNKDRDDSWLPVKEFVEKPINPRILIEKVKELI
ncbi:MAG: response regulator [Bacteriovoracaceae bacterium]|nr:response regulator [Bacteriovoracaceae bacterium]